MDFEEMKGELPGGPSVEYQEIKGAAEVLDPNLYGLLVGVLVGVLTLLFVWWWSSRSLGREILICGTCDGGKTTLLGQLVAAKPVETYTSMKENLLPLAMEGAASLTLVDVPGSERVRGEVVDRYAAVARGLIFVVDSATVTKQIRDVAEYLHSLLSLPALSSNSPPVLVLCNKQDLAMAKSGQLIRAALEKEMDKVRLSRGNQLAAQEGMASTSVFIGREGKSFEFSDIKSRVEFCEASSQDLESLEPVSRWLRAVA